MTFSRFGRSLSCLLQVTASLALVAAGLLSSACATSAEWRWDDAPRVVAMSDVHGAHDAFVRTLNASGLLDDNGRWSGGDSHLVITGDLLDRGPDSRDVMDLLMRLEDEAPESGGQVHLLLGNHEVMNLVGDLRYVSEEEYAAFAADEDAGEREHWYGQHLSRLGVEDSVAIREEFERRYPPGFFAHRRAFRADGHYGAWLLQKPVIVVIDGTAFVHGGLAPSVAESGLEGVNRGMVERLRDYVEAMAALTDGGVLQPGDSFYNHSRILDALPVEADRPADVEAAIETLRDLEDSPIHDSDSPLWYRGTVGCSPIVETARLVPVLEVLEASRVVVGHTPTVTHGVLSRLDGRVLEIDTGMLHAYYDGSGHALVIEGDALSVIDEQGAADAIEPDPRLNTEGPVTAAELEEALASGELTEGDKLDDGALAISVRFGEQGYGARFFPARKRDELPELAAYRLDRLLGLYMVPVTVARNVDGREGSLQLLPDELRNERERAEARAGASAWCPLQDQWAAMYRFDTLTFKPVRSAEQILYDRSNWQLILSGHADAFGNGRGRPPYLKEVEVTMDTAWRDALGALSDARLDEALGDILDRSSLRALKRRRDDLLLP